MTGNKVTFAVIGAGHIGKRHAAIISNNPECELAALSDVRSPEELGLEKYQVPFYGSLEEMLESSPDFDVLCVATPNGLHEEHALKAIRAGRHVLIEKPMGLTRSGCEQVISEALRHQKEVFCVMQNRYSAPAKWLKDIVSNGVLGRIYMVQINCFWNRDERYYKQGSWHGTKKLDGGTLFTQFSHFVDIMYWLFGDIQNIQSTLNVYNHHHLTEFEDSGFVRFEFVNGGMGSFNFSTSVWDTNFESSLTIIAENGTVKLGGQYMERVEYSHIRNYTMPQLPMPDLPNDYGAYKGSAANHHYVFQNVVDVLKGRAPVATSASEGLKVVEIIQKMYDCSR